MNEIHAIVLAAGKSERMGRPKMLLPFGEKTIIETVTDNILTAGIRKIVVVLGSDAEKIGKVIGNRPVTVCCNPDYEEGMHSSVVRGFSALPEKGGAAMLFLGDQPFISPDIICRIAEAWHLSGKGIILPVYEGKRGHPVLFDMRMKNAVMKLDPLEGLRSVIAQHPEETEEVRVNFPEILRDIDTKNDYLNELNLINKRWKKKSDSN